MGLHPYGNNIIFQLKMTCDKKMLFKLAAQFRAALLACDKNSLYITLKSFPNGACSDAS